MPVNKYALINHLHTILTLRDGVEAPTAKVGVTYVYVDEADGDLKVMFGDGVVKTLATDT